MKAPALMITCEHASNALPDFVLRAFRDGNGIPEDVLASHRGYDIGAYNIFSILVKRLKPDFHCSSRFSRLVVDMNRSSTSKSFYSEYTAGLPSMVKAHMLTLWEKYREKIENFVAGIIPAKERKLDKGVLKVIHLGIHSFTPVLNGVERDADVGILYDPSRPAEAKIAATLIKSIHERAPWLKIRKNYPYLGKSDGLTTTLRQKFGPAYAGIEIEINQRLLSY